MQAPNIQISFKRKRAEVVVAVLSCAVALLAYMLFICHNDKPEIAHAFDVSAPLLLERIIAFLCATAE